MKKAALLLLPLAMASCNYLGIPKGDVSGNLLGDQPSGTIRLTLRGVTLSGVQTPTLDQVNLGTLNPDKRVYAISFPNTPQDGAYELFAYADTSKDDKYTDGEQKTGSRTFVYSQNGVNKKDGSDVFNLKPGWTLMNGVTPGKNGTPFTSIDLNW
ncbi:hypothetical protein [Deinococcus soli (ex Cha et al. 2016)]|uniref:Uncharacterized protein n=2 Tax=Deinococcus soli (ex Cha et al. 2016) TaxID=1309411 RepID=A0ACC6KKQ2_9DEIO|nr:hypothetical protein [Deinococcus soli (ex Cha et al. 2016)]MDR6220588.1 hypothetical protein [Deinococcus soli (ex Cha et al. 2016)]MDR6330326.1 hypothetical protein [Deinococcus soli (ex Cha et al. 2016)]MDR6753168.1 hypothetical protein [Deinococcus soli (ex Cha et al. 2016)]